jgi:hypothetical protein
VRVVPGCHAAVVVKGTFDHAPKVALPPPVLQGAQDSASWLLDRMLGTTKDSRTGSWAVTGMEKAMQPEFLVRTLLVAAPSQLSSTTLPPRDRVQWAQVSCATDSRCVKHSV